jgi:histidyl-tRNA synthetase
MDKQSIPKGTRDFSPADMARRNYIFDTIKEVFKLHGYMPVETPAMENLSTLLGKYGEEGDKLLFKILNSGDFLININNQYWENKDSTRFAIQISDKGLRYDLTVPFARYVVQHQNEIIFPFKRYQIQPVWRADRPQKGRYREFYQCDADVIGSNSLYNEVELMQIIDEVFKKLKINIVIKLNNRKILAGIAEMIGETNRLTDITIAIDKFDKIGLEKVNIELEERGLSKNAISKLQPVFALSGNNEDKIAQLKTILADSPTGMTGIEEVSTVNSIINKLNLNTCVELDLTLARGLNYYTGAIFEVKALDVEIGSITGGGRYDDLTGVFGLKGVSGVGMSFGADRIFDIMNQLNLYPEDIKSSTQVLFVNFGIATALQSMKIAETLRNEGIKTELYPDNDKIKKQMTYADKKNIPYVAIIGEDELKNNTVTLKQMQTGEQQTIAVQDLIKNILQNI